MATTDFTPGTPRKGRPTGVLLVAILYIAAGTIGLVYHFQEYLRRRDAGYGIVWIELLELLALLFGIALLFGRNWARWGALAWMAFHVVVSAFDEFQKFAVHAAMLALLAWLLFHPSSSRFFHPEGETPRPSER